MRIKQVLFFKLCKKTHLKLKKKETSKTQNNYKKKPTYITDFLLFNHFFQFYYIYLFFFLNIIYINIFR